MSELQVRLPKNNTKSTCEGVLRTICIDKKIPEYADHAINPVLIAGSAGLFSAGVVTKAAHKGVHAGVDLYHKF